MEKEQKRFYYIIGATLGAAIIAAAIMMFVPIKAKAAVVCDLEASVGVGVAKNTLKEFGDKIDLSSVGALGGLGAGCDIQEKSWLIGAMARASWMDVTGDLGSASLKSDQLYEVAGRAGLRIHEKYAVYGLVGWSWMNLDLPEGIGSKHPNGLLLGGGVDFHVNGPIYARTEYTWHNFSSQGLGEGTKLEPDLHVVRAALVWKFNDPKPANIFEDDKPAPKRKRVCDPKLANC